MPGLALLGLMIVFALILFWHTGLALNNIAVPTDRTEDPSPTHTGEFIGRLSISLFLIVLVFAQMIHLRQGDSVPPVETKRFTNRAWLMGVGVTLIVVIGTIIYVDPRGLYGTNRVESRLILARGDKLKNYARLAETPDVVVLGSSRAFAVLPEFFKLDLGYSAFNMSVEGARVEDYVIQTKYIVDQDPQNPPKVLMIEISAPLSLGTAIVAQRSPLWLLPYMDEGTARQAIEFRLEGLLDLQQFNEAIYAVHYFGSHQTRPGSWTFGPDGGGSFQGPKDLQSAVQRVIEVRALPRCANAVLNRNGTRRLEQIVKLAADHHIAVIFYTTPRHPDYYNQVMEGKRRFLDCETAMQTYMDDLMDRYSFVFYLSYPRLEDIGGVADETGYYDAQHMTPLNNHYLVQTAAGTIRQAYDIAVQKRAASH